MKLIPGADIADQKLDGLRQLLGQSKPLLYIVLATTDPAAKMYTQMKQKRAAEVGIDAQLHEVGEEVSVAELQKLVKELSAGAPTLVQLPLYPHLEPARRQILDSINPENDVDCLSTENLQRVYDGEQKFLPATVQGIWDLLEWVAKDSGAEISAWLADKSIVIVNNSDLIGKPLAALLKKHTANVTVCDINTLDLAADTSQADVLISATGKVGLITADMVKAGAALIDVGSIKTDAGVRGDIDPSEELNNKVSYLTPVPGGVGPMTIACLLENVFAAS